LRWNDWIVWAAYRLHDTVRSADTNAASRSDAVTDAQSVAIAQPDATGHAVANAIAVANADSISRTSRTGGECQLRHFWRNWRYDRVVLWARSRFRGYPSILHRQRKQHR
jgi:hypothetical protein